MSPGKHAATRWRTYIQTHHNILDNCLRRGAIQAHDLTIDVVDGSFVMEGRIECQGGTYIDVSKRILILDPGDNPLVRTEYYSYNVALRNVGTIFRYDSPHRTHNREHHVHRYDVLGGDTVGVIEWLYEEDDQPTLGEVIAEAEHWYYGHQAELRSR